MAELMDATLGTPPDYELTAAAAPPRTTPLPLPPLVSGGLAEVQRGLLGGLQQQQDVTAAKRDLLTQQQAEQAPVAAALTRVASTPAQAPPPAPTLPAPYQRTNRPFLEGLPGESPYQSLQRVLGGLSLIATQAKGAFSGYPQGALAALSGALTGWAQGDQRRGDTEFENFRTRTAQGIQQWQMARQEFEDALKARHSTVADLGLALKAIGIKYDLPKEMLDLAGQDAVTFANTFAALGKTFLETGWKAEDLGIKWDISQAQQKQAAANQEALRVYREQQIKLGQDRLAVDESLRRATLGHQQNVLAETQRHNIAMENRETARANAGANKVLGNDAAKWANPKGDNPPATMTIAEAVAAGYQPEGKAGAVRGSIMIEEAMNQIQRLLPALEKKGLLAGGPSGASMLMAGAQRYVLQPGDPDLGAFLSHSGTMVSALRGLGDIGPRAMAAYSGAVNLIDKVQTAEAVRRGIGQIQNLLALTAPSTIQRTVRLRKVGTTEGYTLKLAPGERVQDLPDGFELE